MKYSTRLSDAVHILILIAVNPLDSLSSTSLANSIQTNPCFIRQLMMLLKHHGLILSRQGRATPQLARPADQITLLDIYRAIEKDKPLLHLGTDSKCPCVAGALIHLAVKDAYEQVQQRAEEEMNAITLQYLIDYYCNLSTDRLKDIQTDQI